MQNSRDRWPLRRDRAVFPYPPQDALDEAPRRSRRFSESHQRLLAQLRSEHSDDWALTSLLACLQHLTVSDLTGARSVDVLDAWTEGKWTFCVVYRYPGFDGPLGLRRTALDATHPGRFTSLYGEDLAVAPDPVQFGRDVAVFDIGEPLGTVVERLRQAPDGINWWGSPAPE